MWKQILLLAIPFQDQRTKLKIHLMGLFSLEQNNCYGIIAKVNSFCPGWCRDSLSHTVCRGRISAFVPSQSLNFSGCALNLYGSVAFWVEIWLSKQQVNKSVSTDLWIRKHIFWCTFLLSSFCNIFQRFNYLFLCLILKIISTKNTQFRNHMIVD